MMAPLSIVLFLSVILFVSAIFQPPTKGTTAFCFDFKCVTDSLAILEPYDATIIAMLSYDFAEDSYLGLYLGSLLELFDSPEMYFVALVLQMPPEIDRVQTVLNFARVLPRKTIFAAVEHGRSMTGMATMRLLKQYGVAPRVVYHLNHEQPWQVERAADPLNHIFDSVQELTDLYAQFPLVLRNYYYEPLLSTSYYLPVSAPFEGAVVQNASSDRFVHSQTSRASTRRHRCHFRGRVDYKKYTSETDPTYSKVPELIQSDELYPQAIQRREIIRLSQENKLGGCEASSSDVSTQDVYSDGADGRFVSSYDAYTSILADTAFVLCPMGNSAETFRHTEAMEFGAIPIILEVTDPAKNYMLDGHWAGYPGPVLSNWTQLEGYLQAITDSEIDALQYQVRTWYAAAKARKKLMLMQQLKVAFDMESGDGGSDGGSSGVGSSGNVRGASQSVLLNSDDSSGSGSNGGDDDIQRIITDLTFSDIPPGQYQYSTQSLLAMLIKQDARIKLLERSVELLLAERGA